MVHVPQHECEVRETSDVISPHKSSRLIFQVWMWKINYTRCFYCPEKKPYLQSMWKYMQTESCLYVLVLSWCCTLQILDYFWKKMYFLILSNCFDSLPPLSALMSSLLSPAWPVVPCPSLAPHRLHIGESFSRCLYMTSCGHGFFCYQRLASWNGCKLSWVWMNEWSQCRSCRCFASEKLKII